MARFILEAPLFGVCLEAWPGANQVPLSIKPSPTVDIPEILKPHKARNPRTHAGPLRQLQLHDSRGLGFSLARALVAPNFGSVFFNLSRRLILFILRVDSRILTIWQRYISSSGLRSGQRNRYCKFDRDLKARQKGNLT